MTKLKAGAAERGDCCASSQHVALYALHHMLHSEGDAQLWLARVCGKHVERLGKRRKASGGRRFVSTLRAHSWRQVSEIRTRCIRVLLQTVHVAQCARCSTVC